jgi:hypothetical protein
MNRPEFPGDTKPREDCVKEGLRKVPNYGYCLQRLHRVSFTATDCSSPFLLE